MSGNTIGGVLGGVIGFMVAGPAGVQYGFAIGSMVGGLLMPDTVGLQDQSGPRLSDLKVTTSTYGSPMARVYGSYRIGGNIIWANNIKETKHVEEVEVGKGGSETYDVITYTYSIDMALALCEGPIGAVKRIWADSVLIYDEANKKRKDDLSIKIYLGTSDQPVDWFLQGYKSNSPAYRHTAYIVFNNFQLAKFGDRIPNITAEVITVAEKNFGVVHSFRLPFISSRKQAVTNVRPINSKIHYVENYYNSDIYKYVAVENGVFIPEGVDTGYVASNGNYSLISNIIIHENRYFGLEHRGTYVAIIDIPSGNAVAYYPTGIHIDAYAYVDGDFYVYSRADAGSGGYKTYSTISKLKGGDPSLMVPTPSYYPEWTIGDDPLINTMYVSRNNEIYTLQKNGNYSSNILVFNRNAALINTISTSEYPLFISDDSQGRVRLSEENGFVYAYTWSGNPTNNKLYRYSNTTQELITNLLYTSWYSHYGEKFEVYDGIIYIWDNNLRTDANGEFTLIRAQRDWYTDGSTTTLANILIDLFEDSNLQDYDVTAAESIIVKGFVILQTSTARSSIAVLQSIYNFDLVEEDFQIIVKIRGEEYIKEINNVLSVNTIRKLDTELPQRVTVAYANHSLDYQIGTQSTLRTDGNSDNNLKMEFPAVLSDTEAKQLSETLMYRSWSEKISIDFIIPMDPTLKVSDVILLIHDNASYIVRVVTIILTTNKTMECTGLNEGSYVSEAIGSDTSAGFNDQELYIPTVTDLKVFNAPTLDNAVVSSYGLYTAANGYDDTWNGCEIFKSTDSGLNYSTLGVILNPIGVGSAHSKLQPGPTTIWDLENTVTVYVHNYTLTDTTFEKLLMGETNNALIGNEVIQYMYAQNNGNDTYTLSTLLRGRRGTEWAIDTHETYELFVNLTTEVQFAPSTINTIRHFKGVTFGTYLDDTETIAKLYDGTNLKPLSPSYVNSIVVNDYDIELDWTRRSRYISGYFRSPPLIDTPELYNIDVYFFNTYKNTYQSSTSTFTYTKLMQDDDNIVSDTIIEFRISQQGALKGYKTVYKFYGNIPTPEPIGYWKLDEDDYSNPAVDSIGNNHGNYVYDVAPYVSLIDDDDGHSMYNMYNTTNGGVLTNNNNIFSINTTGELSISMYIYLMTNDAFLMGKTSNNKEWGVYIFNNVIFGYIYNIKATSVNLAVETYPILIKKIYHVAVNFTGYTGSDEIEIYINGINIVDPTKTHRAGSSYYSLSAPLAIGYGQTSGGSTVKGRNFIDDVKIFDKVLPEWYISVLADKRKEIL